MGTFKNSVKRSNAAITNNYNNNENNKSSYKLKKGKSKHGQDDSHNKHLTLAGKDETNQI